jgi:hypothetical protein
LQLPQVPLQLPQLPLQFARVITSNEEPATSNSSHSIPTRDPTVQSRRISHSNLHYTSTGTRSCECWRSMKAAGAVSIWWVVCFLVPLEAALDVPVVESTEVMLAYAEAGDAISQYNLALSYQQGQAGPPNSAKALTWYRKAADAGVPEAQYNLAIALLKGDGTAKDEKAGAKWLYSAASQGLFEAQLAMIRSYAQGIGVEVSMEKAFSWDCLARRTLELRFEQPAGKAPEPSVLRPDGYAEYTINGGRREAIGPNGTIERFNSDGSRTRTRVDGVKTDVRVDGVRESRLSDGSTKKEFLDGRVVSTDRNGTIETRFPDGTKTLEGDAKTAQGERIRVTEKYDATGNRLSQRFKNGDKWIEQFSDGSQAHEIQGVDAEGRGVRVIDRYAKDGTQQERKIIRDDGVERKGEEVWVVERWVTQPDGREARVREKYGLGGSSHGSETLETRTKPVTPPSTASATSPQRPAQSGTVMAPVKTPEHTAETQFQIFPASRGPGVFRAKESIEKQLSQLAEVERDARYFPGVTTAQAERARAAAARFFMDLPNPPQRPPAKNWLDQRISDLKAPPPPAPLVELSSDLTAKHPTGMYGRELLAGGGWKHAETEHFVAHYRENSDAYPVMRYIECAYFVAAQTLQLDTTKDRRKMHVFVFPDAAKWAEYTRSKQMPPSVLGFAYKDELFLGAFEDKDQYLKTLCHEAAHAVASHFYPTRRWPLWLNEGFAEATAIRSLALRRGHKIDRYLPAGGGAEINVQKVVDRIRYGAVPGTGGMIAGPDGLSTFYPDSERCVRTLLEKLPAGLFPKFANRIFAGNGVAASLKDVYGDACPTPEMFALLVNKP